MENIEEFDLKKKKQRLVHFYLVEDVSETQHQLVIKVTGKAPHSSIERKIQLNWAFPQLFEKT